MDIRPMTFEEAKEYINKFYGNYREYRRAMMNYADAEREVVDWEIKRALKECDGDVAELVKRDPGLYERSRGVAIKIGLKTKV